MSFVYNNNAMHEFTAFLDYYRIWHDKETFMDNFLTYDTSYDIPELVCSYLYFDADIREFTAKIYDEEVKFTYQNMENVLSKFTWKPEEICDYKLYLDGVLANRHYGILGCDSKSISANDLYNASEIEVVQCEAVTSPNDIFTFRYYVGEEKIEDIIKQDMNVDNLSDCVVNKGLKITEIEEFNKPFFEISSWNEWKGDGSGSISSDEKVLANHTKMELEFHEYKFVAEDGSEYTVEGSVVEPVYSEINVAFKCRSYNDTRTISTIDTRYSMKDSDDKLSNIEEGLQLCRRSGDSIVAVYPKTIDEETVGLITHEDLWNVIKDYKDFDESCYFLRSLDDTVEYTIELSGSMIGDENVITYAQEGETVQFVCINGTGNNKYVLSELKITDENDEEIEYSPVENLKDVFTFVMPAKNVSIVAKYDDVNPPTILGKVVSDDNEELKLFEERSEGDEYDEKTWALKKGTKVHISTVDSENEVEGYIYIHKLGETYDTSFDSCDEKFLFTYDEGKDYIEIELTENCEILMIVKEKKDNPNISTAYAKFVVFEEPTVEIEGVTYIKGSKKDFVIPVNLNGNVVERVWLDDVEITDKITVNNGKVIIPADSVVLNELEVREESYSIVISYVHNGSGNLVLFEGSDNVDSSNVELFLIEKIGWVYNDLKWYYYADGSAVTGWRKINNKWYYFNKTGEMLTDWQKINNKWYYFSKTGEMLTSWQKISNKWYYFSKTGEMLTGWQKINNKWYYFETSGAMVSGWK